jgi:hypothetical protein
MTEILTSDRMNGTQGVLINKGARAPSIGKSKGPKLAQTLNKGQRVRENQERMVSNERFLKRL